MSTHNLCFEQKYEKYHSFLSENFKFMKEKFSIYLNRCVFIMTVYLIAQPVKSPSFLCGILFLFIYIFFLLNFSTESTVKF